MSGLKEALRLVNTRGLAPLTRASLTRPANNAKAEVWLVWGRRQHEVVEAVTLELEAAGARVADKGGAVSVNFCGVKASSTQGLLQALHNWTAAAEKRLRNERGNRHG